MDDAPEVVEALKRLANALERARVAEELANARTRSAEARIVDAEARIADADTQTAHADAHMRAAKAHMSAAEARMADADVQAGEASTAQEAADKHMGEAERQSDLAMHDADQYQRALHHYMQLVRHRIANPLHIIQGMAQTLIDQPDLDRDTRRQMIESINDQAHLLERLSLFFPDHQGPEEGELHPKPFE
jgi:signal transduction histidine kinase